jgi:hypothetical protein
MRALTIFLCALSAPALAADFDGEPTVRELQRAAERHAEVHPERVRAWMRRIRLAGLAPSLTVRVGRGGTALEATSALDGSARLTVDNGENWRFETAATWSLDRLVFDKEELRLARESQRLAARREKLLTEVAHLYFDRRRLQIAAAAAPPEERAEANLQIDELTAILDGLSGGALSRTHGAPDGPD